MSNPPDPNELLKLLLKQQQDQQQQQQQQQQLQARLIHQLTSQWGTPHTGQATAQNAPKGATNLPQNFPGEGPGASNNQANVFGNLVDYIKNSGAVVGPSHAASPGTAPLLINQNATSNYVPGSSPGFGGAVSANQQQLLALSKLLNAQTQGGVQQKSQLQHQTTLSLQHAQNQQLSSQQQSLMPEISMGETPSIVPSLPQIKINGSSNQSVDSVVKSKTLHVPTPSQSIPGQMSIGQNTATSRLPPEPVSLLTLQTWKLDQLESHARQLEECNQPIPNIVKILLDDARHREEKRRAKRISNRKSATVSRARKRQLIDELTADNARLRRQALIMSYLPDPVIAIGLDGKIKFCNVQLARVLQHEIRDLEGARVEDVLVPESQSAIRRLIQDLAAVEKVASSGGWWTDSGSDRSSTGKNQDSASNGNAVSKSSDQSFTVTEVNVKENDSDYSGGDSSKEKGEKNGGHKGSWNEEPSAKKSKTDSSKMNVDDVMGSSVTANNAGAKLSSLMHHPENENVKEDKKRTAKEMQQKGRASHIHRKQMLAPQKQDSRSSSSTESDVGRKGINSSEDSGYMEDSNSNESSDDFAEDSSSLSRNSTVMRGNRPRPLAPSCFVQMICGDLTTMWCELTSSIRTRTHNDEDSQLGMIDRNPKPVQKGMEEEKPKHEKELILCVRPIRKGNKVSESLRFPNQVSESSNDNEEKDSSSSDALSSETQSAIKYAAQKAEASTGNKVQVKAPGT